MFHPTNFLERLAEGKSEYVQLEFLWRDLENDAFDVCVMGLPDSTDKLTVEWLKATNWYKNGGYKKVRLAEILSQWPLNKQAEAATDALIGKDDLQQELVTYIAAVKAKWGKPC